MNIKLKFWDSERKIMLESAVSQVTAFRNYINLAAPTGFSDCPNQPEAGRYIPIASTFKKDKNGVEIWSDSRVLFEYEKATGIVSEPKECLIMYENDNACFSIVPADHSDEFEGFPLFAIEADFLEVIGSVYED